MSQEHEKAQQTGDLSEEGQQALSALRGIWSAQNQTSADIDETCGNTKSCKNMETVGFGGLIDDVGASSTPTEGNTAVGHSLRAAWKTKLEREGKLNTEVHSVRDLVFGSPESKE